MKYTINFYLDDLKPKVHYLTLKNTVLVCLLVAVLMGLWHFFVVGAYKTTQQQNNALQQQVSLQSSDLSRLQQALVEHNDKATFNQRKQRLEKSLKAKQMLWQGVGINSDTVALNVHTLMDQLTQLHDQDIWLTHFSFASNQIVFQGFALDSSAVTRWMTKLQSSSAYKGREFSFIKITKADEQTLKFQVATVAPTGQGFDSLIPVSSDVGTLNDFTTSIQGAGLE